MSSLDMSLDDISKASRGSRGGSRGGRGGRGGSRNGAPQQQQQQGPMRNKQRHSGGGASAPRQQQPYARAPLSTPLQYAQPIYAAPQASNGQWKRDLYASPEAPQQQQQQQQAEPVKKLSGDTIHVSNLASDVSDDDVREIFQRIGKVTSCVVNFNSSGKSTGTATVTFARKQDAEKAVEDYDEAEVDGRPMKLKLVGTVVTAPVVVKKQRPVVQQVQQQQQPPLQPQLAYLPQQLFAQQPLQFAQSYQPRPAKQQQQAPSRGGSSRGGRGGASSSKGDRAPRGDAPAGSTRGGRGGARGGRGGKNAPQEVSSADLDKEMDSYHQTREAAVAAATPAAAGQPTTV